MERYYLKSKFCDFYVPPQTEIHPFFKFCDFMIFSVNLTYENHKRKRKISRIFDKDTLSDGNVDLCFELECILFHLPKWD